ncbi:hypothetical protein SLE2022_172340 [Rubroshorea leprosula]
MSLYGKLEADVEIKAPANKFHEVFCSRPHHISTMSPDKIQACNLHEGDLGKEGSVIGWNYVHDGEAKVGKQKVEAIDQVNNSITLKLIEGDVLKQYKSFVSKIQATPKGNGSVVHWTFEYEKLNQSVAHPETLLDLAVQMSKDIDSYLTQA